jgi:hypothetical protein
MKRCPWSQVRFVGYCRVKWFAWMFLFIWLGTSCWRTLQCCGRPIIPDTPWCIIWLGNFPDMRRRRIRVSIEGWRIVTGVPKELTPIVQKKSAFLCVLCLPFPCCRLSTKPVWANPLQIVYVRETKLMVPIALGRNRADHWHVCVMQSYIRTEVMKCMGFHVNCFWCAHPNAWVSAFPGIGESLRPQGFPPSFKE